MSELIYYSWQIHADERQVGICCQYASKQEDRGRYFREQNWNN